MLLVCRWVLSAREVIDLFSIAKGGRIETDRNEESVSGCTRSLEKKFLKLQYIDIYIHAKHVQHSSYCPFPGSAFGV